MKRVLFFCMLFAVVSLADTFAQNAQTAQAKSNVTVRKRGCFTDNNQNGVCDNCEQKTCKKASFNESDPAKKANMCDGSGYSLNQKKKMSDSKSKVNAKDRVAKK